MADASIDPLICRLDSLEEANTRLRRANRRLLAFACIAGSIAATVSLLSPHRVAEAADPKAIEGTQFILKDKDNKPRMVFKTRDDGSPVFTMFDKDGKPRLGYTLNAEGIPSLALIDQDGKARVGLALSKAGGGSVHLNDKNGKVEIAMDEGRLGNSPRIRLVHPKNEKGDIDAAELYINPDSGNATLQLCTPDLKNGGATLDTNSLSVGGNNVGAPFWVMTKDHPMILLSDKSGGVKAQFGLDDKDALVVRDADGKVALPKGQK